MTKDYLKFRNATKKDSNLTLEESYMLELIFDYYNVSYGYAFPPYETLMSDLKTKRKAKISKLLKSLVKKGYISIIKKGKNNTYKLLKYLFIYSKKKDTDPAEEETIEKDAEITEDENKIIELGFNHKQAKSLLQVAKDKVDKVIKAFNYAIQNGAEDKFKYTRWGINNFNKINDIFKPVEENDYEWNPKTKFDNFRPREYEWDSLEKRLLGWE